SCFMVKLKEKPCIWTKIQFYEPVPSSASAYCNTNSNEREERIMNPSPANLSSPIDVPAPIEFSYAENISYLSRSSNECMFQVQEGCVRKALVYGQETALVEI